jgi:hypothetical protein
MRVKHKHKEKWQGKILLNIKTINNHLTEFIYLLYRTLQKLLVLQHPQLVASKNHTVIDLAQSL